MSYVFGSVSIWYGIWYLSITELCPGGYYLHTSLNKRSKKNRTEDLAGEVGLSVEFLGDW
jgi:hypothetical protein